MLYVNGVAQDEDFIAEPLKYRLKIKFNCAPLTLYIYEFNYTFFSKKNKIVPVERVLEQHFGIENARANDLPKSQLLFPHLFTRRTLGCNCLVDSMLLTSERSTIPNHLHLGFVMSLRCMCLKVMCTCWVTTVIIATTPMFVKLVMRLFYTYSGRYMRKQLTRYDLVASFLDALG